MNQIYARFLIGILMTVGSFIDAGFPLQLLQQPKASPDSAKTIAKPLTRLGKRLQSVEKEFEQYKTAQVAHAISKATFTQEVDTLKNEASRATGKRLEFCNQKLSLASQMFQVAGEIEQTQNQISQLFSNHIKLLQESVSQEGCSAPRIPAKAYYGYEEVQELTKKITEVRGSLNEAEKVRLATIDDSSKRKKALALIEGELKDRIKARESFSGQQTEHGFSAEQQGELLDKEIKLTELKRQLAELKVIEADRQLSMKEDQISCLKIQLAALEEDQGRLQGSARITESYVKSMERQLATKRQLYLDDTSEKHEKLALLQTMGDEVQQKIQDEQRRYRLTPADLAAIRSLDREPKKLTDWGEITSLIALVTEQALLEVQRMFITAEIDTAKARFAQDELEFSMVRSWYKMTSEFGGFATDEEVEQEIKGYQNSKAEQEAHIAAVVTARDAVIGSLQTLNASLDKIMALRKRLQTLSSSLKIPRASYETMMRRLYEAEEKIRSRSKYVAQLVQEYATTLVLAQDTTKRIDTMIAELKARSFWRRSSLSIRWSRLNRFIPDMERFIFDVQQSTLHFFSKERVTQALTAVRDLIMEPLRLLLVLINLIIFILLFILLRLYLPDIRAFFRRLHERYTWVRYLGAWGEFVCDFFKEHSLGLYVWTVLFGLVHFKFITDVPFAQLFFLFSIVYLLYVATHFFASLRSYNQQNSYQLMSVGYETRFFWLVSTVAYAFIILGCVNGAFLRGGYGGSQVSLVLQATMVILLQITVISLIGKEQILWLLRSDTPLAQWAYERVNRYYYIVWGALIAFIIVINPYIGYGRQVLYIVKRLVVTAVLIPLFVYVHNWVKRVSIDLFFYHTEAEEVKERFWAGRFWYGLFVISTLVLFLVAGIYLGARIWGFGVGLRDMLSWLTYPFYTPCDEAGNEIRVSILSILEIGLYIFGGFIIAYLLNQFLIRRILDPFLASPGIQSTVSTLIKYVIVVIAAFMGLTNAGLEGLTTKLAILLAGLSFAAQDAVRDFFSYFILLVQRPVKIGDLIEIIDGDKDRLTGVVRHITPRSIMIRRRNSTTVIIPNSKVVMNPVMNWSYSRSFIAFDDIEITLAYSGDPLLAKKMIAEVLDKNPNILKSPKPVIRLSGFVDSGFQFIVRGYLSSDKVQDQWDIASDIRFELIRVFRENKLEMAFPVYGVKNVPGESEIKSPEKPETTGILGGKPGDKK